MTDDRQLEALLRDGLAAQVRPVVAESRLTEQIISAATLSRIPPPATHPSGSRTWQNWTLPAVAAVLVALLLGSVLFGVKLLHSAGPSPAGHPTPTPAATHSPSRPERSSAAPSASSSGTFQGTAPESSAPTGGPVPAGFRGYDLTWISPDQGWALGTAPCASAPCTSLLRTTDGGLSWVGLPAPPAYLAQSDTCAGDCPRVTGIRFVNAQVGYSFGPSSFWMTTDGGQNWSRQPGDAWALEAVAGQVLRVTAAQVNCAPGCHFQLQRAAVGSSDWQDVTLPAAAQPAGAELSADGDTVVLSTYGNPAGGASNAQAVLFGSTDGGASWRTLGEPCPQAGGEVDTAAVAVAPDGSISAICRPRGTAGGSFLVTSTNGGRNFAPRPAVPGGSASVVSATAAGNVLAGSDRLSRWNGSSWQTVAGPVKLRFIGFETPRVGRVLADNGLWTTADGGQHWSRLSY